MLLCRQLLMQSLTTSSASSWILLIKYVQSYRFCLESGFTFVQTQLFLSFVREVFEQCMVSNDEGELPSSKDAVKSFYDLVVCWCLFVNLNEELPVGNYFCYSRLKIMNGWTKGFTWGLSWRYLIDEHESDVFVDIFRGRDGWKASRRFQSPMNVVGLFMVDIGFFINDTLAFSWPWSDPWPCSQRPQPQKTLDHRFQNTWTVICRV